MSCYVKSASTRRCLWSRALAPAAVGCGPYTFSQTQK
jgi:hypothetical protein